MGGSQPERRLLTSTEGPELVDRSAIAEYQNDGQYRSSAAFAGPVAADDHTAADVVTHL